MKVVAMQAMQEFTRSTVSYEDSRSSISGLVRQFSDTRFTMMDRKQANKYIDKNGVRRKALEGELEDSDVEDDGKTDQNEASFIIALFESHLK